MIEIVPNWHPIFVHFSVGLLLTSVLFHLAVVKSDQAQSEHTHDAGHEHHDHKH